MSTEHESVRKRVLLVEDNAINMEIAHAILEEEHLDIAEAKTEKKHLKYSEILRRVSMILSSWM